MEISEKYNRLTLVQFTDYHITPSGRKFKKGLFTCDCGNTKETMIQSVRCGDTKSCGCLGSEINKKRCTTHGYSGTKIRTSWLHMIERCTNPKAPQYLNYGGRGIEVCSRWMDSFDNFLKDMGEPESDQFLDRIDVNEGYYPENCRWTSIENHAFNKRILKTNTSGKSGVSLHKGTGKWCARINKNGKRVSLGYFDTFEEALLVREKAELEIYGYNKE